MSTIDGTLSSTVTPAVAIIFHLCAYGAVADDKNDGFTRIFDVETLNGWHVVPESLRGDWSVKEGLLIGNSNGKGSDLIWKIGDLGDFELKLSYRFRTEGNSGIHIRGRLGESKTHRVKGYHADFGHVGIGPAVLGSWDFHGSPRGNNLVDRGHRVVIDQDGKKHVSKIVNAVPVKDIRKREWNKVHVVVRGRRMYFTINGKLASEVIDNQDSERIDDGVIGLQIHGGPPMTIEFRDIRLKRIKPAVSK